LEEKGVKVHIATDAENAALKAVMQPAFAAGFAEETGEDGKTLLGLVQKLQ